MGYEGVIEVHEGQIPTRFGGFRGLACRLFSGAEHLALVVGEIKAAEGVLARVHSACLTGEATASDRCDCQPQLQEATRRIAEEGSGVILYNPNQEGRGIGLLEKLAALAADRRSVPASWGCSWPARARPRGGAVPHREPAALPGLGLSRTASCRRRPDLVLTRLPIRT